MAKGEARGTSSYRLSPEEKRMLERLGEELLTESDSETIRLLIRQAYYEMRKQQVKSERWP